MKNDEAEFCRVCGKPGWQTNKHKDLFLGDYCSAECLDKAIAQNTDVKLLKKEKKDYQEQNAVNTYPMDISWRNRKVNPGKESKEKGLSIVKHIKQISDRDCAVASIAMFLNVPYSVVVEKLVRDYLMYWDMTADIELLEKSSKAVKLYYLLSLDRKSEKVPFTGMDHFTKNYLLSLFDIEYFATNFMVDGVPCMITHDPIGDADAGHCMFYNGSKLYDPGYEHKKEVINLGDKVRVKFQESGLAPYYGTVVPMNSVFVYNLSDPLVKKNIHLIKEAKKKMYNDNNMKLFSDFGYFVFHLKDNKLLSYQPWKKIIFGAVLNESDRQKFYMPSNLFQILLDSIILSSKFYREKMMPLEELKIGLLEIRQSKSKPRSFDFLKTINGELPIELPKAFTRLLAPGYKPAKGVFVKIKSGSKSFSILYDSVIEWNIIRKICRYNK